MNPLALILPLTVNLSLGVNVLTPTKPGLEGSPSTRRPTEVTAGTTESFISKNKAAGEEPGCMIVNPGSVEAALHSIFIALATVTAVSIYVNAPLTSRSPSIVTLLSNLASPATLIVNPVAELMSLNPTARAFKLSVRVRFLAVRSCIFEVPELLRFTAHRSIAVTLVADIAEELILLEVKSTLVIIEALIL